MIGIEGIVSAARRVAPGDVDKQTVVLLLLLHATTRGGRIRGIAEDYDEADHPRDDDGRFARKGGRGRLRKTVTAATRFHVVGIGKAPFSTVSEAKAWAERNGVVGVMSDEETGGKCVIEISKGSVKEMLNGMQIRKSDNAEVHFAALAGIRDIIKDSEVVEVHPDFRKMNGTRSSDNGTNPTVDIAVLYGAIRFNSRTYRVKTRLKLYKDPNLGTKAYSYQVNGIDVSSGALGRSRIGTTPWTYVSGGSNKAYAVIASNPRETARRDETSIPAKTLLSGITDVNGNPVV